MINNSNEEEVPTKTNRRSQPAELYPSTWSGLKNPRIVRVSRAFGGKDRHSKVTTVRGLRDRRVRLSVQTAIQLYDLQDKLGFNQPSKVVDWLITAAQHEIDKLPPLQIPPSGNFNLFPIPHMMNPWSVGIPDNISRVPEKHPQHATNAAPDDDQVKHNFFGNASGWNNNSDVLGRIKSGANGDDQGFCFPNNGGGPQFPYNLSESSSSGASYAYYPGNRTSSNAEAFNPISLFGTNFDGKHYNYLTMSGFSGPSEGNQEHRDQNAQQ